MPEAGSGGERQAGSAQSGYNCRYVSKRSSWHAASSRSSRLSLSAAAAILASTRSRPDWDGALPSDRSKSFEVAASFQFGLPFGGAWSAAIARLIRIHTSCPSRPPRSSIRSAR